MRDRREGAPLDQLLVRPDPSRVAEVVRNSPLRVIGTGDVHPSPTPVPGISDVAEVSLGTFRTCVVLNDARVFCWGSGIVGDGSSGTKPSPVLVTL